MTIEEIFEQELFKGGYEVISDFLGYDYPEDENKDVTSNRIQQALENVASWADFEKAFQKVVKGLVVYNIQWDIDMDEVLDKLDDMTVQKASETLGVPYEDYANMSTDERHDYAYDCFHHNACDKAEFMGIPEEIQVPTGLIDEEDISEWLSDEYGYCHEGFNLKALN